MKLVTFPDLKHTLKDALRNPNRKAFYFQGGRGAGKSTLLAATFEEVLEELAEEQRRQNEAKKHFFNNL
jgi:predicted ATPase